MITAPDPTPEQLAAAARLFRRFTLVPLGLFGVYLALAIFGFVRHYDKFVTYSSLIFAAMWAVAVLLIYFRAWKFDRDSMAASRS